MFMTTKLIEPHVGKLMLNHMIGNNSSELGDELLDNYFFKLILGSNCLELFFRTVTLKTNLAQ